MIKIFPKLQCIFSPNSFDFFIMQKRIFRTFAVDPVQINLTTSGFTIESDNSFASTFSGKFLIILQNLKILLSLLSASSALSMTLNGANGATRDSMLKALRMNGLTPDMIQ